MPTRPLPRHCDTPEREAFYSHIIAAAVDPEYVMLKLAILNGQREDHDDPRDIGPHRAKHPHTPHRPIGPLAHELTNYDPHAPAYSPGDNDPDNDPPPKQARYRGTTRTYASQ